METFGGTANKNVVNAQPPALSPERAAASGIGMILHFF
jgi:hypothetical protein